ncbi:photosystem II stability/assembly factor-like uncharacterized protein [Pseudoduganella flava]|uniref:Photosystem II stability/assembly factor-like uncharacterized protein n=1 Tax=Pseudoduganella flava TaxID=871742 RepID=A0A562PZ66_9BURK|nr:hypothetical protein [Pseudoduganella flava]QGZ38715.1 hypothetical protein GO485_06400 [Pseudoduganella flava]TWI49709.1 photosystem II stability/assembly factor-like uncharacterized protein [Pseudoduganella flava]
MRAIAFAAVTSLAAALPALAQQPLAQQRAWQPQASGTQVELRGLAVVSATVAWASGAKGTVLRTTDGSTWTALAVPGAEALDLRDIAAFDADTAIAMSAGPGAASRIYRTRDGGATWQLLITNPDAKGFWDAIAFWDARHGVVFGDPVDGRFQVRVTNDGGDTWRAVTDEEGLRALPDEGAFAASGTCLTVAGSADAWFATGGAQTPRVFHSKDGGRTWQASAVPVAAGAPARGLFSVGFRDARVGIATGGDYKDVHMAGANGARSEDGGASWTPVQVLPAGYMSVVVPVPGAPDTFVAAGLAGSGYSVDAGRSWKALDGTPVNTVGFASPTAGWAVGPKGLVLKYVGAPLNR